MGMDAAAGQGAVRCSIAPWLSVRGSAKAVEFYKAAFGATEAFRVEDPSGNVVARLAVDGAEFWWEMSRQNTKISVRRRLLGDRCGWF